MPIQNQNEIAVIRAQGESLAKLRGAPNVKRVHIMASDAIILIDQALAHERFATDDAVRNMLITLRDDCRKRIAATFDKQSRACEPADPRGCLCTLSLHDFAMIVDSATLVAQRETPELFHGVGSNAGGDGVEPMRVESIHANVGAIDETASGALAIEGANETLAPENVGGKNRKNRGADR